MSRFFTKTDLFNKIKTVGYQLPMAAFRKEPDIKATNYYVDSEIELRRFSIWRAVFAKAFK
jgi:hypothetical protein